MKKGAQKTFIFYHSQDSEKIMKTCFFRTHEEQGIFSFFQRQILEPFSHSKVNVLWKVISACKYLEEISKSSRPPRFAGQICRETLNEIRSLSFPTEEEESIWDDVKEKLEEFRT